MVYASDVVQGWAGDDQRGREAQELRPQADEEESDRGDQAAAAHHEREGQPSHFNLQNSVTEEQLIFAHIFPPFSYLMGGIKSRLCLILVPNVTFFSINMI